MSRSRCLCAFRRHHHRWAVRFIPQSLPAGISKKSGSPRRASKAFRKPKRRRPKRIRPRDACWQKGGASGSRSNTASPRKRADNPNCASAAYRLAKLRISRNVSSGCSSCGICPHSSITSIRASGRSDASRLPNFSGTILSCSHQSSSAGLVKLR